MKIATIFVTAPLSKRAKIPHTSNENYQNISRVLSHVTFMKVPTRLDLTKSSQKMATGMTPFD